MRILIVIVGSLLLACGGGAPTATRTAAPATPRPATPAATTASAAALCFLTPADWQQFNYVTGSSPDVTTDESGTFCQYASGLFLEVYPAASEADAESTFDTVLENVPMDNPQSVPVPGADEVAFDADIGDNHAGMAVRAGRLTFFVTGLARDTVQAELTTLAGLVLSRSSALQ
jgi:hypothetical protein